MSKESERKKNLAERPMAGGAYSRDPETGKLTLSSVAPIEPTDTEPAAETAAENAPAED